MKKTNCLMIFLVILFIILPSISIGGNHYIRSGATGNNNGSDWTNAWTELPGTLTRGDTYYVADGSYGYYEFDDEESGSTYIYIKKAVPSDHGTDTGWYSTYGDGSANFTFWRFYNDYYHVDGQVGQWASDLPDYVAYGFRVLKEGTVDNAKVIHISKGSSPRNVNYITLKHVEAAFTNTPRTGVWYLSNDIIYGCGDYWTLSYLWLHDAGRCNITTSINTGDHGVIEYSVLERNGHCNPAMGTSEHSEIYMLGIGADDWDVRYNYIRDWRSTGCLVHYDNNKDIRIYGNIFEDTGYWLHISEAHVGDGVITGLGAGSGYEIYVYNNTFVNLRYGGFVFGDGSFEIAKAYNNLFYNCVYDKDHDYVHIKGDHDYNAFYDTNLYGDAENHMQDGFIDPFIDREGGNFQLRVGTAAGDNTIGELFSSDMLGDIRGADGMWERGAFEYTGEYDFVAPVSPGFLEKTE